MTIKRNLLVVGARTGSIGDFVANRAFDEGNWNVVTAGITEETVRLPLDDPLTDSKEDIYKLINGETWHAVVCTVGINDEGTLTDDDHGLSKLHRALKVNVLAPLAILEQWLTYWADMPVTKPLENLHFVVLSSNSAHVPRSTGLPYNPTKAALSMAVRCVARDIANKDARISVYAYEPGWVEGTPMSNAIRKRLPATMAVTRTPGGRLLDRHDLAKMIVHNLSFGHAMNGATIRVDGGEA